MTLFSRISDHIETALAALVAKGALPDGLDRAAISVEPEPPNVSSTMPFACVLLLIG